MLTQHWSGPASASQATAGMLPVHSNTADCLKKGQLCKELQECCQCTVTAHITPKTEVWGVLPLNAHRCRHCIGRQSQCA